MSAKVTTPLLTDQPFDPHELAAWCGGTWDAPPEIIRGVMHDSRAIRPGNLYVALPGATVDGHAFVAQALQAGAAGALVQAGGSRKPRRIHHGTCCACPRRYRR